MRSAAWAVATAFFAALAAAPPEASSRDAPRTGKAPEVVEAEAEGLVKLALKSDPAAVGWLFKDFEREEGRRYGLLVSLHGHGGTPQGVLFQELVRKRRFFSLAVQGHTPEGPGFAWDEANKAYIAGLAQYVIEKYPVDRKAVLMTGHSAGGTMCLATFKHAPAIFAGIMTTAAPATPDSGHFDARTVVFLGDQDPNYAVAGSVRSNFDSKKRRAPGSLRIVRGLGHDVPHPFYLGQGMDWILDAPARGGEVSLPKDPPVTEDRPFAHILLRHAGAQGAEAAAPRRSKAQALGELRMIRKLLDKKLAHFALEAATASQDEKTAASGGRVSEEELEAFAPALREAAGKLEPGQLSEVLESPQGVHLIVRLPAAEKK
jgi:pimeloyl-ACP methyl ester carboxylesterase